MSTTDHIAKLLVLSDQQAVTYCEQVRKLSGLGPTLHYRMIYDQLLIEKPPYPEAAALAKKIRKFNPKQKLVLARQAQPTTNNTPKNNQPGYQEKISIYEHHDVVASIGDTASFVPSHLPKDVERYSYLDHERVVSEKLEHCRHGVPIGQLCAICNAKAFRDMTGID